MTLKMNDAQFLTAAVKPASYPPEGPPEVAFAGRSNVGKSSLINTLLGRRKLVRVSQRPGCTQQINFFSVNRDALRLVDLPGYGFAKVPLSVKAGWRGMLEAYLTRRASLKAVVVILDIRRDPSEEDLMLLEWLKDIGAVLVLVLTKADKLSRNQAASRLAKLLPQLATFDARPQVFSSLSGLGKEELLKRLEVLLTPPAWSAPAPATPPAPPASQD